MENLERKLLELDEALAKLKQAVYETHWQEWNRSSQAPCHADLKVVALKTDMHIVGPCRADAVDWQNVTDWRYAKESE